MRVDPQDLHEISDAPPKIGHREDESVGPHLVVLTRHDNPKVAVPLHPLFA
jgi:hypothetical protein